MNATWFALGPVLIGMFLLVGLMVAVALLADRRTRHVGLALPLVGGGLVVLGGLAVLGWAMVSLRGPEVATMDAPPRAAEVARIEVEEDAGRQPPSSTTAKPSPAPTAPPEKASGVLPAVGNSLARAASETGVARASRSVQDSPGVLAAAFRALGRAIAKEHKQPHSGDAKPARPAWVDAEPSTVDGAYWVSAKVTGLTAQECDEAQPEEFQKAAALYVEHLLGPGAAKAIRLSPEFIQKHAVGDVWEETVMVDYGGDTGRRPTILRHVLLTFGPSADQELNKLARAAAIHRRLRLAGCGLAAVLALLGLAFAYLKINLTTGGRYRGRLRAAAIAVILATVAVNALILAS